MPSAPDLTRLLLSPLTALNSARQSTSSAAPAPNQRASAPHSTNSVRYAAKKVTSLPAVSAGDEEETRQMIVSETTTTDTWEEPRKMDEISNTQWTIFRPQGNSNYQHYREMVSRVEDMCHFHQASSQLGALPLDRGLRDRQDSFGVGTILPLHTLSRKAPRRWSPSWER